MKNLDILLKKNNITGYTRTFISTYLREAENIMQAPPHVLGEMLSEPTSQQLITINTLCMDGHYILARLSALPSPQADHIEVYERVSYIHEKLNTINTYLLHNSYIVHPHDFESLLPLIINSLDYLKNQYNTIAYPAQHQGLITSSALYSLVNDVVSSAEYFIFMIYNQMSHDEIDSAFTIYQGYFGIIIQEIFDGSVVFENESQHHQFYCELQKSYLLIRHLFNYFSTLYSAEGATLGPLPLSSIEIIKSISIAPSPSITASSLVEHNTAAKPICSSTQSAEAKAEASTASTLCEPTSSVTFAQTNSPDNPSNQTVLLHPRITAIRKEEQLPFKFFTKYPQGQRNLASNQEIKENVYDTNVSARK